MAKYTLEEIMYGDKYGIESAVFVEVFRMVEQKVDAVKKYAKESCLPLF